MKGMWSDKIFPSEMYSYAKAKSRQDKKTCGQYYKHYLLGYQVNISIPQVENCPVPCENDWGLQCTYSLQ